MCKKRRLWMKWGIMLLITGFLATDAYGQSWKWELFLDDLECNFFYDPDTVSRSPDNVLRVWWKEFFKTKEVLRSRGFTDGKYDKVVYQINVSEINCNKKESRRKFFMLCSDEGESIICNIHKRELEALFPVKSHFQVDHHQALP